MKKRAIVIFLILSLTIACLPTMAFAGEASDNIITEVPEENTLQANTIDSENIDAEGKEAEEIKTSFSNAVEDEDSFQEDDILLEDYIGETFNKILDKINLCNEQHKTVIVGRDGIIIDIVDAVMIGGEYRTIEPEEEAIEGYNFTGWYYDSSLETRVNFVKHQDYSERYVDYTPIIYANWEELEYNPVLHKNDGSDIFAVQNEIEQVEINYHSNVSRYLSSIIRVYEMPANDKVDIGESYSIDKNTPSMINILLLLLRPSFICWNTKSDGTGTSYKPGDNIASLNENLDLYAMWEFTPYLISYDLDGGDESAIKLTNRFYISGYGELTSLPIPTKEGYTFEGWYDENGIKVSEIDKYATGNKHLKAKWSVTEYTVIFYDGFGNIISKQKQEYGSDTIIPNKPTRKGFIFKGWTPELSDKVYGDAVYSATWDMETISLFGMTEINTGDVTDMLPFEIAGLFALVGIGILLKIKRRKIN